MHATSCKSSSLASAGSSSSSDSIAAFSCVSHVAASKQVETSAGHISNSISITESSSPPSGSGSCPSSWTTQSTSDNSSALPSAGTSSASVSIMAMSSTRQMVEAKHAPTCAGHMSVSKSITDSGSSSGSGAGCTGAAVLSTTVNVPAG